MQLEKYSTLNQSQGHSKTSEKYSFIPTQQVLSVLSDHGYFPAKVQEARTRIAENKGFQKHIVRLRQERHMSPQYHDEFPEIVLINSHMGSASFRIMLGYFRVVCTNGMIAGNSVADYRVMHKGYTDDAVSHAITAIGEQIPTLETNIEKFRTLQLSDDERRAYAKAAIELKWSEEQNTFVDPRELSYSWRSDDKAPTLWNTFNIVQEKLIKGGVHTRNANNQRRRARAITSVDENVKINRALWTLTEEMAKIKAN